MHRLLVLAALTLALPGTADAAPPTVAAQASPTLGAAPLATTLTAAGDASSYRWELPDGSSAVGPVLAATFAQGRHTVTLVGTSAGGEEARATVTVTAVALSLAAPAVAGVEERVHLRGRMVPALPDARLTVHHRGRQVTSGRLRTDGSYRIGVRPRAAGEYVVRYAGIPSPAAAIALRPRLRLETRGAPVVGGQLTAVARVEPAGAGIVTIRAYRRGRLVAGRSGTGAAAVRLPSVRPGAFRVVAAIEPRAGYVARRALLDTVVRHPSLGYGSRSEGVRVLEQRLRALAFVLQRVDAVYGRDTVEAVLAFQKLHGLPRTGRVDARFWRQLAGAAPPRARYGGDHIEVDKRRQVLMLVRGGRVTLVAHVSTGATGNTPVGHWRVYRKVGGWDWVLWYPMYFLRGFAIHGYPEVPAHPASHGCVRVPMWLAPRLFATHGYGTTIIVY